MKRLATLALIVTALWWRPALATDDPHGSTGSISCEECHVTHGTLGDILVSAADSLVSTRS